jgi:hypothetical protein
VTGRCGARALAAVAAAAIAACGEEEAARGARRDGAVANAEAVAAATLDGGDAAAPGAATDAGGPERAATAAGDRGPPARGVESVAWGDPAAVAREALSRLRDGNVAEVLLVATADNAGHRPPAGAPQAPAGAALFGAESWRARAVAAWNGEVGEARVVDDEAWVSFGELPEDRVAFVLLRREGARWRLHDLRRTSRARWRSFAPLALP